MGEHIRNLAFSQSTLESFPQDLVFLLVKTFPKNVQVIIVQTNRAVKSC